MCQMTGIILMTSYSGIKHDSFLWLFIYVDSDVISSFVPIPAILADMMVCKGM